MEQVLETEELGLRAIEGLRSAVCGKVYTRRDEGFDAARAAWNLTIDQRPRVIVAVDTEDDVVEAVRFAELNNLPIAVQTTGHGQPRACEGGLLLLMGNLNKVEIDAHSQTARMGGGTVWKDVLPLAAAHNLAPVSGSSGTVGVVGYTLGGGYGLLSRKYGLASDTVESFRIVTPDGCIREVSPESNSDLFWAVLGGGGSYGVITQITMRLFPVSQLFGGSVMFDASLASEVYPAFVRWVKTLPEEVSAALTMMTFPPVPAIPEFLHGRSMLTMAATALGIQAQAEEWLAPIRSLAGAEFDSFQPMTYDQSPDVFRDPVDPLPANGRGVLLNDLDEEAISTLLEAIGRPALSPNLMIQIRHLEGAISRPGRHSNSTGDRRRAKYVLYFLGIPMGPVTLPMMEAHAENAFQALGSYVLSRGPLNWLGEGRVTRDHVRDVFHADEYARLQTVKRQIDPANRFRFAGVGLD